MGLKWDKGWHSHEWKSNLLKENSMRKSIWKVVEEKNIEKMHIQQFFFCFNFCNFNCKKVPYSPSRWDASRLSEPSWAGVFWIYPCSAGIEIIWELSLSCLCKVLVCILIKLLPAQSPTKAVEPVGFFHSVSGAFAYIINLSDWTWERKLGGPLGLCSICRGCFAFIFSNVIGRLET